MKILLKKCLQQVQKVIKIRSKGGNEKYNKERKIGKERKNLRMK